MMLSEKQRDWGLLVGRILLGALFLYAAYGKLTDIPSMVGYMGSVGLPESTGMAWLVGLFELVLGLALVLGVYARCLAMLGAVYLLIVSLKVHWDPADMGEMTQFFKNLAVAGGLLTVSLVEGGKMQLKDCKKCVK